MLELGMGRGDFIIHMAQKYPRFNFIGVELNLSQMVSAVQRLGNQHLPNLKLIHLDARDLDQPWPKKQDEKRRFTHESYLRLYDKIFQKNKHIILKTDNKKLFAYSLETLSQYWYSFERVSLDLHHDEEPIENVMTDFEKVYYKEGRPIYYVDARYED